MGWRIDWKDHDAICSRLKGESRLEWISVTGTFSGCRGIEKCVFVWFGKLAKGGGQKIDRGHVGGIAMIFGKFRQ
jgi:hypothetical protein